MIIIIILIRTSIMITINIYLLFIIYTFLIAGGGSELGAACLTEDLLGARLPAYNRLNLAWRALDELLFRHSQTRQPALLARG
jgi:hypothetical protein